MQFSSQIQHAILALTADVVTRRLGGNPLPLPALDDPLFTAPTAGCFVSLHRKDNHALRGCVGLLQTGKPMREVLVSAAESVLGDPRFLTQPVTRQELLELEIEVTLLGPMERAKSPLDFEPLQRGIYLTLNNRSGLFLPQVARETRWTREQLLGRLCTEKLGLPETAWNDPAAILHTFTAEIVGPKPVI
jgi:AmmeMemoRadiSam system protein A